MVEDGVSKQMAKESPKSRRETAYTARETTARDTNRETTGRGAISARTQSHAGKSSKEEINSQNKSAGLLKAPPSQGDLS